MYLKIGKQLKEVVNLSLSLSLCFHSFFRDIDMAEFLSSDPEVIDAHIHTVYDLMANICHDGKAGSGKGTYRVHIRHKVVLSAS